MFAPYLRRRVLLSTTTALFLVAMPSIASAASLVYYDHNGGSGNPRGLYNYDTTTGVSTLRVPIQSGPSFRGMAVRPTDGVVFAVALHNLTNSALYTLDIDTGASSLVGLMPGSDPMQIHNIAFHPTTNVLYGVVRNAGGLYTIDQTTAQISLIGGTHPANIGIDFLPNGSLLGFSSLDNDLFTISTLNGDPTLIGGGGSTLFSDAAATAAGEFFVADYLGKIIRVNTATGQQSLVGTTGLGDQLQSLIAVPEPSSFALLAVGVIAVLLRQRRYFATTLAS